MHIGTRRVSVRVSIALSAATMAPIVMSVVHVPAAVASTGAVNLVSPATPNSTEGFGAAAGVGVSQSIPPGAASVVGIAASPDGGGYWEVGRDGGIFAFGDAAYFGSMGGRILNRPIVGIAATPDGHGYWLVASDGGVFGFGDAAFLGSMGGRFLNRPVVGMAAGPNGNAYWLVASDGGVFRFGDVPFYGSMGGQPLNRPVIGMATSTHANGYWLMASDGGIFAFGGTTFFGSSGGQFGSPAVGIAARPEGDGYWVVFGKPFDAFGPFLGAYLAGRQGSVTAAVYDATTDNTQLLNPGVQDITASIVKADILATALYQNQGSGQLLTSGEAALSVPMIEVSDNNAASGLFGAVGGPGGVSGFNQILGMNQTAPNGAWGFTATTAADQVTLVKAVAYPNFVLGDPQRNYELSLMENVTPSQAWGVSGGVPGGVTVALKNGWLPDGSGWHVNSIGWISGQGRNYVLAVLTSGDPDEGYGIATIQAVAATVWANLAP